MRVSCYRDPFVPLTSQHHETDSHHTALNEDGTYRDNVFLQTIGEAYIPIAFQYAQAADPDARLFYNDYNLEYGSAKAQGAARIVQLVQSYGARIDGVGLQGHLTSEPTTSSGGGVAPGLSTLESTLALYTDLGVDVAYTELDVRFNTTSGDLAAKLETQADVYVNVFQSCLNNERCIGITIWGATDKYSWIPGVFSGEGDALLWDDNYQKKPAYQAVLDAINAASNSTSTQTGAAKYRYRNMRD
jgi:endo-1,4-beta-xylanase